MKKIGIFLGALAFITMESAFAFASESVFTTGFKIQTDYKGTKLDENYNLVKEYFESSFIGTYCTCESYENVHAGHAYLYASRVKVICTNAITPTLFYNYLENVLRDEIRESEGIVIFINKP